MNKKIAICWPFLVEKNIAPYGKVCFWQASSIGQADANNDNKITARELHAYVEQNVIQQSSGSQTPQLQGDKDRVLIQFQ